jgi:hypothetical protein
MLVVPGFIRSSTANLAVKKARGTRAFRCFSGYLLNTLPTSECGSRGAVVVSSFHILSLQSGQLIFPRSLRSVFDIAADTYECPLGMISGICVKSLQSGNPYSTAWVVFI